VGQHTESLMPGPSRAWHIVEPYVSVLYFRSGSNGGFPELTLDYIQTERLGRVSGRVLIELGCCSDLEFPVSCLPGWKV
jgi:hypothetical protein